MRIAVFSDVHGNLPALEAVLEDIAGFAPDAILNLGDHLSGPIDPAGTAQVLMGLDIPTLKGNHDRWLSEMAEDELDSVDRFTLNAISAEQVEWLGSLPGTTTFGDDIFLCHATSGSDTDFWLEAFWEDRRTRLPDETEVSAKAAGIAQSLILCGHTHLARAVRLRDGRQVINPGSVGLQIVHGSPDARYAVLEQRRGGWAVSLRAVPYDHQLAAKLATANGFGHWTEALTTGWANPEGLF